MEETSETCGLVKLRFGVVSNNYRAHPYTRVYRGRGQLIVKHVGEEQERALNSGNGCTDRLHDGSCVVSGKGQRLLSTHERNSGIVIEEIGLV